MTKTNLLAVCIDAILEKKIVIYETNPNWKRKGILQNLKFNICCSMKLIWQCCTKAVFYHSDILSTQSKKQLTGKTSILQLQRNPCSWRSGGVFPATFTMQNNWEDIGWLSTVIEQIYWVQCTMKTSVM